jgi:hypothetical protein
MVAMADERQALIRALDIQRHHVLGILDGLTEEQLHRPVLPSGWSCLGLVHHLAVGVEHYWFRCIAGGEPTDVLPQGPGADWVVGPDQSGESVLGLYRQETALADRVIAATPMDAPPRQRDEWWGDWDVPDFRFILVHVITEVACHAGHLDAAVELLAGRQWIVVA